MIPSLSSIRRPGQGFATIMADCPWAFLRWDQREALPQRAEDPHYDTMTFDDICGMPVRDLASKDAVLHLWAPSSHLHLAYDVAEAWGFAPKSLGIVWIKTQKSDPTKPKMGMGKWFRQEVEITLLFTRGSPGRMDAGVRQVIETEEDLDRVIKEPRREHSRKPDEQYNRFERLSDGPYLELFARQQRPNWSCWGNETDKFPEELLT